MLKPECRTTVVTLVNGIRLEKLVDVRKTLADFLREEAGCVNVRLGCEHGVCGACTVLVDGLPVRSCLRLAPQAQGQEITTLEGLMETELGKAIGRSFVEHFAMQCGFCTAGIVVSVYHLLETAAVPVTDEGIHDTLGGHICRCTGYVNILAATKRLRDERGKT